MTELSDADVFGTGSPEPITPSSGQPDSAGIRLPGTESDSTQPSVSVPTEMSDADVFGTKAPAQPHPGTPSPEQKPGLWEGIKRGAQQFDIGSRQLSGDLINTAYQLAGKEAPYGKQDFDPLNQAAAQLEQEGRGTGLKGAVGEIIGNPTTYLPMGEVAGGSGFVKTALQNAKNFGILGAETAATAPSTNEQGLGERAWDATKAGLESAPMGAIASAGANQLGKLAQWGADKSGLSDAITYLGKKFGTDPKGSDLYEMAQKIGLPTDGKTPKEIYGNLQNWFSQNVDNAASKVGSAGMFSPLGTSEDITQNFMNAQRQSDQLYGAARMAGQGKETVANDLQKQLANAINSLASKKFPTASEERTLSNLTDIQENLGWAPNARTATIQTGTTQPATAEQAAANAPRTTTYQPLNMIKYNDLVDLKQALNEGFDTGRFSGKGDRPVASLFNNVKNALGRAAQEDFDPVTKTSPFGDALYAADRHYSDELAPTFHNDTLKKFWTPDDYYDYKTSNGWTRRDPNVDTLQRTDKILDNIRTPADMQAITRAMSPEQANNLLAAKFKQTLSKAGIDGQQIADNYDVIRGSLGGNREALKLLDNIKQGVDILNERGIGDNAKFYDANNRDLLKSVAVIGISTKLNRPFYALREAAKIVTPKEGTATEERISNLARDIMAGNPRSQSLAPVRSAVSRAAGTAAAESLGDRTVQNDEPMHINITRPNNINGRPNMYPENPQIEPPAYARGGRVNKYGKPVGILSD